MLKQIVPKYLKNYIKFCLPNSSTFIDSDKIFILLAAKYGNLGDVAITFAQREYLERIFPNHKIYLIYSDSKFSDYRKIIYSMNKNDLITIVGGGNFGNIYEHFLIHRNFIFRVFKNFPMVSFPQTIDFTNDKKGVSLAKKTKNIINKTSPILFFRERKSYNLANEQYSTTIKLVPDIVLSSKKLQKTASNLERKDNIIFCLRDDEEKEIGDVKEVILNIAKEINFICSNRDTHIKNDNLTFDEYEAQLFNLLDDFSKSKLVITDRLHGMIFCYLTKTPCLFFDNSNRKVSGVYDWIKPVDFIQQTSVKNLEIDIKKFISNEFQNQNFKYLNLENEFEPLKLQLLKLTDGRKKQ